ncbi:hypothetical protein PVK06_011664 [Gossypium arboreum]|uniref:Uncharacterized protein n=1 Tax=Gossypium arboreum TaxID=29729 RepID=A0ABR0Q9X9_GOSAR|nr:hypothetical protein PVK06_011664 [Gossypium arboreum]
MQVGPNTHQRIHREVETRDVHIPSSMRGVYHHFGGHVVTIGIAGGWTRTHRGAICYDLFGATLNNIHGDRIDMGWLRNTFSELGDDSTEVERIRCVRAYILKIIGGYLMSDLS